MLTSESSSALRRVVSVSGAPVVTILLSGRPLILGAALAASDAFLAAWLPGTEGLGVTDVLFGDFKPTGKLPRVWPQTADTAATAGSYPFGFGLSYEGNQTGAKQIKTASAGP